MPFCPNCGSPVPEEARYCPHCGASAEAQAQTPPSNDALFGFKRGPTSRLARNTAIAIVVLIVSAFLIGGVNSTAATVYSTTVSGQNLSIVATCHGFGSPTYTLAGGAIVQLYQSFTGFSVTSDQFGRCYFGYYISNGNTDYQALFQPSSYRSGAMQISATVISCKAESAYGPETCTVVLANTGSIGAFPTSVCSITFGGLTVAGTASGQAVASGVSAGSSATAVCTGPRGNPADTATLGSLVTGSFELSNGGTVPFAGTGT